MDIVEKLRATEMRETGWELGGIPITKLTRINPDGPEAADEIERLREALQELVDWQNGPPLVTYTDGWNKAMEKASAALKEGE